MQKNNEPVPTDYRGRPFKKMQGKEESKVWWELLSEKAKTGRDLVLVGAGLIYLAGFYIWTVESLITGLGPTSVQQVQYITSGLWTIVTNILMYGLFSFGRWIGKTRVVAHYLVTQIVLLLGLLGLSACCVVKYMIIMFSPSHGGLVLFAWGLAELCFMAVLFGLTYVFGSDGKSHQPDTKLITLAILLFVVNVIVSPIIEVHIPEDIGGFEPRCAVLSLKRTDLTPIERQLLLPNWEQPGTTKDTSLVVSSVPLNVLFDNQDQLEVRPESVPKSVVIELKRSDIVNIEWFGYSFPDAFLKKFAAPPPTPPKPTPIVTPKPKASKVAAKKK